MGHPLHHLRVFLMHEDMLAGFPDMSLITYPIRVHRPNRTRPPRGGMVKQHLGAVSDLDTGLKPCSGPGWGAGFSTSNVHRTIKVESKNGGQPFIHLGNVIPVPILWKGELEAGREQYSRRPHRMELSPMGRAENVPHFLIACTQGCCPSHNKKFRTITLSKTPHGNIKS